MQRNLKRRLLIIAGTIFTGIGVVGIFVPLLPTTPFLLLASACYARSSQSFNNRLLNNRFFGAYLKNYIEGKGVPIKIKIGPIVLLWITIGCTTAFAINNPAIRIVLFIIATGVTVHIVLIKTTSKEGPALKEDSSEKI